MDSLYESISEKVKNVTAEAIAIRRNLHAHPEEGWM